jgi:hypothetical protein
MELSTKIELPSFDNVSKDDVRQNLYLPDQLRDVLEVMCDLPSIRDQAIDKGKERILRAKQLFEQGPEYIEAYNEQCIQSYNKRYCTEISRNQFTNIKTYVRETMLSCYNNKLMDHFPGNSTKYFYGDQNFKRRSPDCRFRWSYPPGCGSVDDEIEYEGTIPLPHEYILFNQMKALDEYLKTTFFEYLNSLPGFDLEVYKGGNITNKDDQAVIDTFIHGNKGEKAFYEGEDGYYALAGCNTGKAKWNLAAQLGKKIVSVHMEKIEHTYEGGNIKIEYNTTYRFEKVPYREAVHQDVPKQH